MGMPFRQSRNASSRARLRAIAQEKASSEDLGADANPTGRPGCSLYDPRVPWNARVFPDARGPRAFARDGARDLAPTGQQKQEVRDADEPVTVEVGRVPGIGAPGGQQCEEVRDPDCSVAVDVAEYGIQVEHVRGAGP